MPERHIELWVHGVRTAEVTETITGRLAWSWTNEARRTWRTGTRVLSAGLPIGEDIVSGRARAYLDGVLPEGNARTNHAIAAGVAPDDTLAMMSTFGRDTPGAVIATPAGADDPTRQGHYEPLTLEEVGERLRKADEHSPVDWTGRTVESTSLPGMVPKIALHRTAEGWAACKNGAPSTWILKVGHPQAHEGADVIDTEVACLELARFVGLTNVDAEILRFADGQRAIAVRRFDRHLDDDGVTVVREHQEDMAQALGLNTQDPNRKFQWGKNLPSLAACAKVLRRDGGDQRDLFRLVVFTYLVGNTDMHAKNIALVRRWDGSALLAPAYDISMHLHHRRDNRRFALDVNGKTRVDEVEQMDLLNEGVSWGMTQRLALATYYSTVRDTLVALANIDRSRHPGVSDEAWAVVEERVRQSSNLPPLKAG